MGPVAEGGRRDGVAHHVEGRAGPHRRRPPLAADQGLGAAELGEADAGAVEPGFAEAHARADVRAGYDEAPDAAVPAAADQLAADPGARAQGILERDRQRPQARPRARVQRAPLARRAGAEQAILEGGHRRREAGDELARRGVGGIGGGEDVEAAGGGVDPEPLLEAVMEDVPPGAPDLGDPGAGRRDPAPAGEAGAGDGRGAAAGEALQVDAGERVGAGRGDAPAVVAELGAAGRVGPVGVGADVPAALGDRVLAPPSPPPPAPAATPPPARSPSRRSGQPHLASPTSSLPRSPAYSDSRAGRRELSPLAAIPRRRPREPRERLTAGSAALPEWRNGTSHE